MLKTVCLLALCLTAVAALPSQRIVGGSVTTINQYPYAASVLKLFGSTHRQNCGGTIINNRSVLSAAHCYFRESANLFSIRVGSTLANSGGSVHPVSQIINHASYNMMTNNNDISVLRVSRVFTFGSTVQPGRIPGSGYALADNQVVWAIGWGLTSFGGSPSEQLRHVQIWTVNQNTCRSVYGNIITDNMLCAGWLNVGGRDTCTQDSGGPLLHNGIAVGVVSFGNGCGDGRFPGVYARVSRYTSWVQSNS